MADRIKGITVEIGGDTVGLSKALKDVNTESRGLQKELSDVEKLLKFDPKNAELLAQKQTLLNRQIETTNEKLNRLKSVQEQVQRQAQAGDIGAEQYRAFQREIAQTEQRLQRFEQQARGTSRNVHEAMKNMGGGIANAIAGAVAGAGIGTVIEKAFESAHLETKIHVSFDVSPESEKSVLTAVNNVKAYGVEGETALAAVRKQWALNADASDASNQKIVESAAVIASSYEGIDLTELIQESNEFGDALGISQEDALAMTNTLLKMGFPPDQLDIMSEYGAQLHRAGYSAQEIQGIFAAGVETKSWNIDVLLDGVKEGRIRLAEFGQGVDKTTQSMIQGTGISAQKLQQWGAAVAQGGQTGKIAFGEVATELSKVKDESQRNAIGTRLFGTLWEEQGKKITDSLAGANMKTGDLTKNQEQLNAEIAAMKADPQYRLNQALQDLQTTLAPLLATVAEWVAKVADWVAKNPELAATITAVVVAIGILVGICMALVPVLAILTAENFALALSLIPIIAPFLLIIAIIGAVIAIGILLHKNWDHIMAKASELVANIKVQFEAFKAATETKMNAAKDKIMSIWDKVYNFFTGIDLGKIGRSIIESLVSGISSVAGKLKAKAKEIARSLPQWMKDVLHISSPSKVMMEIGANTGEGLFQGLQNSMSRIKSISNEMAFAAIPAIPKTASTEATGNVAGKAITVNINSPKALDAREASVQFNRVLNKMSLMW
jgi:phage-related minor tail protein